MNRNSLAEYVERMARGDQRALASLYDETLERVYAVAYRILADVAASEEAVSDVYLQAWCNAGRYDPSRADVVTWLLVMCRSRALDALRKRPRAAEEDLATPARAPDETQDPCEAFERSSAVRECLARLSPEQVHLVALAFFRGYSHSEISALTSVPLGSVKSTIRNALMDMRSAADMEKVEVSGRQ